MTTRILNQTGIGLGDYVETEANGYKGRVSDVHMSCPEKPAWVKQLTHQPPPEALEPCSIWFSILTHEGGSIVTWASDVKLIAPFLLKNSWALEYWPRDACHPESRG